MMPNETDKNDGSRAFRPANLVSVAPKATGNANSMHGPTVRTSASIVRMTPRAFTTSCDNKPAYLAVNAGVRVDFSATPS